MHGVPWSFYDRLLSKGCTAIGARCIAWLCLLGLWYTLCLRSLGFIWGCLVRATDLKYSILVSNSTPNLVDLHIQMFPVSFSEEEHWMYYFCRSHHATTLPINACNQALTKKPSNDAFARPQRLSIKHRAQVIRDHHQYTITQSIPHPTRVLDSVSHSQNETLGSRFVAASNC